MLSRIMSILPLLLFSITLLTLPICAAVPRIESLRSLDEAPVLHFTISRRGGAFESFAPGGEIANLIYLAEELEKVERSFNLTRREVKGNKLVRKAKAKGIGGNEVGKLMGDVAASGRWRVVLPQSKVIDVLGVYKAHDVIISRFAKVGIGEPPQEIEIDLDMLASDFYVLTTTSGIGSKYEDYFSKSNVKSNAHPFPRCSLPTDNFHLPTLETSVPLAFAHCRPAKSSSQTLGPSGSVLGLAPSSHLSQIDAPTLLGQLLDKKVIERPIFSIMLINAQEGVLSIGGTAAKAVEIVIQQTKKELDSLAAQMENGDGDSEALAKRRVRKTSVLTSDMLSLNADWQEGWRWSKVQGAEGWWQILLQGVWIDGTKVLVNQPVVIDINTPFILAPPVAAKAFYASVSGSLQLTPPHQNFYVFPCLNPPVTFFEFDGWQFPAMQGGKGAGWFGMPGGKFSLGRLEEGSGYCVGAVVETTMGVRGGGKAHGEGTASGAGELAGNGMRDMWVVGEGFFRGVGGVFDFKEQKVGFRSY